MFAIIAAAVAFAPQLSLQQKERKKTHSTREGWENGTPPPHRDFKERRVRC